MSQGITRRTLLESAAAFGASALVPGGVGNALLPGVEAMARGSAATSILKFIPQAFISNGIKPLRLVTSLFHDAPFILNNYWSNLFSKRASLGEIQEDLVDAITHFMHAFDLNGWDALSLVDDPHMTGAQSQQAVENMIRQAEDYARLRNIDCKDTAGIDDLHVWHDGDTFNLQYNLSVLEKNLDRQSILFLSEARYISNVGRRLRCFDLSPEQDAILDCVEKSLIARNARGALHYEDSVPTTRANRRIYKLREDIRHLTPEFKMPLADFLRTPQTPKGWQKLWDRQRLVRQNGQRRLSNIQLDFIGGPSSDFSDVCECALWQLHINTVSSEDRNAVSHFFQQLAGKGKAKDTFVFYPAIPDWQRLYGPQTITFGIRDPYEDRIFLQLSRYYTEPKALRRAILGLR